MTLTIQQATERYEAWLASHLTLIPADLELKHQRMAESPFPFLRATFYRWVQRWPEVCPDLATAPVALSIGDLHVENFGTWRDAEGRLIWGINDFDEAFPMPYTNDLVRLAASAILAIRENHLSLDPQRCVRCDPGGLQHHPGSRRLPIRTGSAASLAPESGTQQPS